MTSLFVRYLIWEEGGDKTKLRNFSITKQWTGVECINNESPYQSTFQKEIENHTNMALASSDSVIEGREEKLVISSGTNFRLKLDKFELNI